MRVGCLHVPHFYVQVEGLKSPETVGRPVVIGGLPDEKASVVDCSEEASVKGVYPGMPLRDAYHLCPGAAFLTFDRELSEEVWEEVLYALEATTLRIEPKEQGFVYLDITKALRLYASEEYLSSTIVEAMRRSFRLRVKMGVGKTRFIAGQAAICTPGDILVIRPETEREFLASLSVDRLPVDEAIKERLRLLGLHRLGKVAGLPRQALVSQFGVAGKTISDIVSGAEDKKQIFKRYRTISLEKEVVADVPFETGGEIGTVLESVLVEVSRELDKMDRVCRKLKLQLYFQDKSSVEKVFVLKTPTAGVKEMHARIMSTLQHLVFPGPVTGFRLSIADLCVAADRQEHLFRKRPALIEKMEGVKYYLEALYGYTPLFMVRDGDKDSRLPERRFVLREV